MTDTNMHYIDLDTWDRKEKFLHYKTFDSAWMNFTIEQNVEKLYEYAKSQDLSFFLMTLYSVHRAIQAVPQFKQRFLEDGRIVQFDKLAAITTVMGKDNEFFDELLEYADTFTEYAAVAEEKIKKAKDKTFRVYNLAGRKDIFCTSCVPWFKWKSLVIPKQSLKGLGFPHVDWDKMDDGYKIRFSIQFNHCFIDGYHVGQFTDKLSDIFDEPEQILK